jgi:GalNAc-alpha-(1->4)-GalNAc-alpha-(1->3)-diNAcBac-PP-undecaprenol alpha-1,4-N-acetyl-D-galactosaminyltransferase
MNKKILIINNGLAGGGIERASTSLANHFFDFGYTVCVLALYKEKVVFQLQDGISFIEPDFSRQKNGRFAYIIKMINFARRETIKFNPDTILAFGEWTNPYVLISLTGLKYPVFVSDRMNPLAKLPLVSEILKKITYRKANGIIAQTNFAKRVLEKKTGSKRIFVINNPVNLIPPTIDIQENQILTVGRLSIEKGHKFLIDAFSKIHRIKDWKLVLVGDGPERENLEQLAKNLGIGDRVEFLGHLKNFSKPLTQASIFVLPSLKEGFPNALIEAMAMGKACISSDFFEGENEIVEEGINGLLFKPGNVDELHLALLKLIDNPDLRTRIGIKASEIAVKLAFPKIANDYLNVILSNKWNLENT